MSDADRLRAQMATSTDPERLKREAKRAELLDLADRCEREGQSRELDVLIACEILDLERKPATGYVNGPPPWAYHTRPRGRAWWDSDLHHIRAYTSSLDAASTLSGWALAHASDIGADGLPYVVLFDGTHEVKGVAGRSLTLTWCAAALRARAEEEGERNAERV